MMVEAAGIEPASKGCDQWNLHVYSVHFVSPSKSRWTDKTSSTA